MAQANADLIRKHEQFRKGLAKRASRLQVEFHPLVPSIGEPGMGAVIVGFCPQVGETEPFTGKYTRLERDILAKVQASPDLVFMTYLVRCRPKQKDQAGDAVKLWTPVLFEELGLVKPRAVILLGLHVARAVLGVEAEDIEALRKTRFALRQLPAINFFVTYAPDHVYAEGGLDSAVGNWAQFDHVAVLEAVTSYFHTTKVIEG